MYYMHLRNLERSDGSRMEFGKAQRVARNASQWFTVNHVSNRYFSLTLRNK